MTFRDLPPVEDNVPPRDKASQTLLARQAVCPRSAYLYLKHDGGPPSHAMHRGSVLHAFHQRHHEILVDQGEPRMPWEVGKDLVAEVVAAHPEWVIPPAEMDVLRLAAYHICEHTVIDPGSVVAVEKLFEMELGGMRVRGRVDVAYAVDGGVVVRDLKSQAYLPSQDEVDQRVQLPLYALLVGEGWPVREEPCGRCGARGARVDCEACGGTGRVEVPEAPIGQRFHTFTLDEVYPRLEPWTEGTATVLPYRRRTITRPELVDHRLYVEGLVGKLRDGLDTGRWPAVAGSHCSTCAAPADCPLPARLRDHQGSIQSAEQAQEAAEKLAFDQQDLRSRMAALREYAKANDAAVPAGADEEFGFELVESEEWIVGKRIGRPDSAAAREAMFAAIDRAVRFGDEFRYGDFRRTRRSARFAKRKAKAVEQGSSADHSIPPASAPAEPPEARQAELDARYGSEAPF